MSERNDRTNADPQAPMSLADMARSVKSMARPSQSAVPTNRSSAVPSLPQSRSSAAPLFPQNRPSGTRGAPLGVSPEAPREGSGLIDLNSWQASSAPSSGGLPIPSSSSLSAALPTALPYASREADIPSLRPASTTVKQDASWDGRSTPAAALQGKRSNKAGLLAGGLIAICGLAAAGAIVMKAKAGASDAPPAQRASAVSESALAIAAPAEPRVGELAKPAQLQAAELKVPDSAPAAKAAPGSIAASTVASSSDHATKVTKAVIAAPARHADAEKAPAAAAPAADIAKPAAPASPAPTGLAGAMQKAVGASESASPAAQSAAVVPINAPDAPSQGAIQSAVGAHMSAAKACVKGQGAPSKAEIIFGSSGKAQTVNVTGAAAGTPAEACIKKVLSSASVGPFRRSTFSVGIPVRP